MIKNIEWSGAYLRIIDQTQIPARLVYRELRTIVDVFDAIKKLQVRGAPAIGVTAAYGLYLGFVEKKRTGKNNVLKEAKSLANYLAKSRPTAVN